MSPSRATAIERNAASGPNRGPTAGEFPGRDPSPAAALACALLLAWAGPARADPAKAEIEALLVAVGKSGCGFIRNGSEHSSADAEKHLRLKVQKGERYADTPEHFIERLGSGSSWTGEPYRVHCPGAPEQLASSWLKDLLRAQRRTVKDGSDAPATP